MIAPGIVLAGAAVGAGTALVVAGCLPVAPDLRSVLSRLGSSPASRPWDRTAPGESTNDQRLLAWCHRHVAPLTSRLGIDRNRADLDLVGEAPEDLAIRKVGYGLLGLAFAPALATAMGLLGLALPVMIPGVAALGLAAALFYVPDLDLRRRATATRAEMRRAVCVYLELVALERAADAGTVEALDRAAAIGDGRAFALIRDALLRARLSGVTPWQALARLAEQLRVPELGDVADIMRLSGEDGAAVYATLRARAASLRTVLLTASAADANAASEHMIMPVACLGVAFMALLGYPAFARILAG